MFSYCLDKFVLILEAATSFFFFFFGLIFDKLDLKSVGWGAMITMDSGGICKICSCLLLGAVKWTLLSHGK
jgi:hypothetical protein